MSEETALRDLLDNRQMPDNATPRVSLGELRRMRAAALAEARASLDVERLARALAVSFDDEGWHAVLMSDDGGVMPAPLPRAYIEAIARQYAAREEPTP